MNDDEIYWDNLYIKKGYKTRWSTTNIQPCLVEYFTHNNPTQAIDIGCGDGFQANYISKFCNVDGLELSNEAVKLGKAKYPTVNFIYKDILEYTTDKKYDFIFDRGFFHTANKYSYTPEQFVKKIYQLITDDGTWLSIIGSADRAPEDPDTGPPRWTAQQIVSAVEPYFKIEVLKRTYLETDSIQKTAWSLTAKKRHHESLKSNI